MYMENQMNAGNQNTQPFGQNPVNQPAPTPEKPKVNYMVIGLIVLACFVVFGLGVYYLGKQSSSKRATQVSQTSIPIPTTPLLDNCVSDKGEILAVVNTFETLQKNKDSKGVLGLFTPPQSQAEISDYQNLSGEDAHILPRLYNNVSTGYNTQSYKVAQEPTKSADNFCGVLLEEQRSNYGGPTNPQYLPAQTKDFALTLIKQNGGWKIDQYQSQDTRIKKGKYAGFLMEYSN
ncbi:MAG: hypothetical protein COX44_00965 [Candidatus Portnoybacteria bacterium CG23_combo_of_CG06-09_8_20_14_all_37_13]|uniref:Uncharacterized protein n=1 Tax=Candidatus Portnoybacteria bacterium CG23_combo_of_CG06-09_8_20_14_all_37_13 TaxID=1974819 RepID=A0A2G9YDF1_9BACT|nr:MAG: hypothetical protein COX44_00965 [Candidatus Portnoybacteria bacterium CG23_combo_of_CG06-09_8_20_14_all_37_13]